MLAHSQGRNADVVNSYNLYIDSAKDVGGAAGKGDSFSLQLWVQTPLRRALNTYCD